LEPKGVVIIMADHVAVFIHGHPNISQMVFQVVIGRVFDLVFYFQVGPVAAGFRAAETEVADVKELKTQSRPKRDDALKAPIPGHNLAREY